jgi:hypothetical protein
VRKNHNTAWCRQLGHQHKTCPPYKLFLMLTLLSGPLMGGECFIKQVPAHLVAYIPRINIFSPHFHEFDRSALICQNPTPHPAILFSPQEG